VIGAKEENRPNDGEREEEQMIPASRKENQPGRQERKCLGTVDPNGRTLDLSQHKALRNELEIDGVHQVRAGETPGLAFVRKSGQKKEGRAPTKSSNIRREGLGERKERREETGAGTTA